MKSLSRLGFCIVSWLLTTLIYLSATAVCQQMEDVVYLKNGSIIRGLIVEHVPDAHIKIQTREGNLLVYRIGEIDRIMKELKSKRIGSKSPGLALGLSLGGGILVDEDVVYLKNGSIIRGLIVEHVPDAHIKIQTREGNLLVYRIGEIDRIMKELKSKRIGSKSPGLALGLSLGGGILVDGVGQFYNGEIGKGFGYVAWSLTSQILLFAGTEDNEAYGFDIDDDDFLTLVGLVSRIACYTTAAVDAYRSAKRKNEEIGYGRLSGGGNRSYPRLNLGFGRRGTMFVRYWQSF